MNDERRGGRVAIPPSCDLKHVVLHVGAEDHPGDEAAEEWYQRQEVQRLREDQREQHGHDAAQRQAQHADFPANGKRGDQRGPWFTAGFGGGMGAFDGFGAVVARGFTTAAGSRRDLLVFQLLAVFLIVTVHVASDHPIRYLYYTIENESEYVFHRT